MVYCQPKYCLEGSYLSWRRFRQRWIYLDVFDASHNKYRLIWKAALGAPSMCRRWLRCARQQSSIERGRQRISCHRRPSTRGATAPQRAQQVNLVVRWRKMLTAFSFSIDRERTPFVFQNPAPFAIEFFVDLR